MGVLGFEAEGVIDVAVDVASGVAGDVEVPPALNAIGGMILVQNSVNALHSNVSA